jgi:hypothetical protein
MNNKIFFSFIVFVFSPLIASEINVRRNERMFADIKIDKEDYVQYEVEYIQKIDSSGRKLFIYESQAKDKNIRTKCIEDIQLFFQLDGVEIQGQYKNSFCKMLFSTDLMGELDEINKASKNMLDDRNFKTCLVNKSKTKKVFFTFTEKQYKQETEKFATFTKKFCIGGISLLAFLCFLIYIQKA